MTPEEEDKTAEGKRRTSRGDQESGAPATFFTSHDSLEPGRSNQRTKTNDSGRAPKTFFKSPQRLKFLKYPIDSLFDFYAVT